MSFQSTRPRGARRGREVLDSWRNRFNPRAREGRDGNERRNISRRTGFNPRAREGRDALTGTEKVVIDMFQSTRPRGARHAPLHAPKQRGDVSIHAPARGATTPSSLGFSPLKFQSTRPRGARLKNAPRRVTLRFVSIHAPARGATAQKRREARDPEFQSTRPRGARLRSFRRRPMPNVFQSTRPRGARRVRPRLAA